MQIDNKTQVERETEERAKLDSAKKELMEKKQCFNCGQKDHRKNDCPKPNNGYNVRKNYERLETLNDLIDTADQSLLQNGSANNGTPSAKRKKPNMADETLEIKKPLEETYKPGGEISEELRAAIGLGDNDVPPWVEEMKNGAGYPGGWLKMIRVEEKQQLKVQVDGGGDDEGDGDESKVPQGLFTYDTAKLIEYPGFNVPSTNYKPTTQSLEKMQQHLEKINKKVNAIIEPNRTSNKMAPRQMRVVEEKNSDEEREEEERRSKIDQLASAETRHFSLVTPITNEAKISDKGLPNLSAWSKGIAPLERNLQTPDTQVKRGTFKKLRELLKKKVV